jgi:class 3 adenylate cyclase
MKGVYLVHASVAESLLHTAEVDAFLLNKLVRRRLNRLDRVVTSQGGVVVRQMARGLLAAFNTARLCENTRTVYSKRVVDTLNPL